MYYRPDNVPSETRAPVLGRAVEPPEERHGLRKLTVTFEVVMESFQTTAWDSLLMWRTIKMSEAESTTPFWNCLLGLLPEDSVSQNRCFFVSLFIVPVVHLMASTKLVIYASALISFGSKGWIFALPYRGSAWVIRGNEGVQTSSS